MSAQQAPVTPPDAVAMHDASSMLMMVAEWMRRSFEHAAAEADLTPPQARALLGLEGAVPMRSLADHLGCDASNITGIADRLEAGGLVTRAPSDTDRRVKLLTLTPAGAAARERLQQALAAGSPLMTELSDDERATLRALLAKVLARADGQHWCGPA